MGLTGLPGEREDINNMKKTLSMLVALLLALAICATAVFAVAEAPAAEETEPAEAVEAVEAVEAAENTEAVEAAETVEAVEAVSVPDDDTVLCTINGKELTYGYVEPFITSFVDMYVNDYGYDAIFSRFVEALGNGGDVLLAISTSGNSRNVLNAVEVAKRKGIKVVALTGKSGGRLADVADVEIRVPHNGEADRIQEVHIKVIHIFIHLIEKQLGVAG